MANYAIYDTDIIVNVIVADSKEFAEEATGLNAIESINGHPWIGWTLLNGEWIPPKPYDSWTWNGNEWVAPVPKPDDENDYAWDEESQSWILINANNTDNDETEVTE